MRQNDLVIVWKNLEQILCNIIVYVPWILGLFYIIETFTQPDYRSMIIECEAELLRNEYCELVAIPLKPEEMEKIK